MDNCLCGSQRETLGASSV